MRYLVVKNNIIENVIELENDEWPVPEGCELIPSEEGNIGDKL